MKKKKIIRQLKRSLGIVCAGYIVARGFYETTNLECEKLRDDLTALQVESDQKSADIEQLQADFCAEVDELNALIETQRQMLATAQIRIDELLAQNTRLLARGGGWVPIVEAHGLICQCLEGCPATLSVVDGELSLGFEKEVFSFVLPDDFRLCAK